jgi:hypothetical protein
LLLGDLIQKKLPALCEQHGKCHTRRANHQSILIERIIQMTEKTQASLLTRILEKSQQKGPGGFRKQWYAPASEEQVQATEQALGFALPSLLRACYLRVSNGGFGPGEGVMGVIGGFEDNRGNLVEAYLWRKTPYRFIELTECEKQSYEIKMLGIPFKLISNRELLPPAGTWPGSLLEFFHHGCGDFSSIDIQTGRIFVGGNEPLWYEANSLEEWVERWLRDEFYAQVPAGQEGDPYLPPWPGP